MTTRLLLLTVLLFTLHAGGCATPRWITASDTHPDDAVNGKHVRRALVAAVHKAAGYEAGATDALVPAGIPAVAVDPSTGKAERRDKAVLEAEKLALPEAAPAGDFPVYHVRALRLSGQTGEVDVVRPLKSGRRVLTVGLDLDPGYGWRATDVRLWRALDPDSGL